MSTLQARRLLAKNLNLPTLPSVMRKLSKLLEDPDTGAREVGLLVAEDAALTGRVLKIANSAYYGLRERCMGPHQAASILGLKVLRNVVLQASVMKQYDHLKGGPFDVDALWRHSLLCAHSCQFLGRKCRVSLGLAPDELYICGLLHDLGQVVMLDTLGDEYLRVAAHAQAAGQPLYVSEQEQLGFTHADVGGLVTQQWGLHEAVQQAVQHHHAGGDEDGEQPIVLLVRAVDLFAHRISEGKPEPSSVFDAGLCQMLGLDARSLAALEDFASQAQVSSSD